MPKYRVHLQTIAMTVVEVEADSKDDAYDKALDKPNPSICAQCSGWGGSQNLELGDQWDLGENVGVDEGVEEVEGDDEGAAEAAGDGGDLPDLCAFHGGEGDGHAGCPGCREDQDAGRFLRLPGTTAAEDGQ
jgi:hypothetical protein